MKERLQKILARAGIASRRAAEELIRRGKVAVDGVVVREMGLLADPDTQTITCDGRPVTAAEKKVYILLNKPKGFVTTTDDPQGRPIVTSLLNGVRERVFPVGRLDVDTEGALILTNDGAFAQRILHPRFEIERTYMALVSGHPSRERLSLLEQGIELEGRKTWPARLRVRGKTAAATWVEITIHEGRKRQVRKMFQAIGHRVLALKRIAYGGLRLGDLPSGGFRFLKQQDIEHIFSGRKSSLQLRK